jgi:hypothetical protein
VPEGHRVNLLFEAVIHDKEIIFAEVGQIIRMMPDCIPAALLLNGMISFIREGE